LKLDAPAADMTEWSAMVDKVLNLKKTTKIALVGKYVELHDAYLSVVEALKHSGLANDTAIDIDWVNANDLTAENVASRLADADGIIVPGGFGQRGTEGKMIQTQNIQLSILCVIKLTLKTWVVLFVSVFTHVS